MGRSVSITGGFGWDLGVEIWDQDDWRYAINQELEELGDIDDFYVKHSPLPVPPDPWDEVRNKPESWFVVDPDRWPQVSTQEYLDWKQETREAQTAYSEAKKKAVAACPFRLMNCSYEDFSHYLLVVAGSEVETYKSVTTIDPKALSQYLAHWVPIAFDIRDLLDLKPDGPPTFLIGASYG